MKILGINSVYHESAAALLIDGNLACFVEEERINRMKHGKHAQIDNPHHLPADSVIACLDYAGCNINDIDYFAWSFAKEGRLQNIGVDRHLTPGQWSGGPMVLNTSFNDSEPIVMTPENALNTFARTGIDVLVLGNHVIFKDQQA